MGLDQYAYVAAKPGDDYHTRQEIAYWRKHPNLQGWMENLWEERGHPGWDGKQTNWGSAFNGIEIELTYEDIQRLEKDIKDGVVANLDTEGFFFGKPSDNYYYEQDLQFCADARAELFLGRKVFYNSSW